MNTSVVFKNAYPDKDMAQHTNEITLAVPRMRTIDSAVAELKAVDPRTRITPYYIRCLVKSGDIPVVHAGRKCLINMNVLLNYLYMGGALHD